MTANFQSGALRARRGGHNPRQVRLAIEYTNLMNLAARSDLIAVEALDVHPGWPPEKYLITYRCRGIVGIDPDGAPKYGDFHQVKMYLPSDYPLREPHLKWMTPIWHPNIDHEVPNHVCTNTAQNYFAGKPLSDLVRAVGEMVQYVRYHAAWVPPYPLDRAAATWVVDYAEPNGIVSKSKPVDDRPLLRPQRMRLFGATPEPAIGVGKNSGLSSVAPAPDVVVPARRRIRLGTSPLDLAVRRPGLAEPARPSPERRYEIPPDEAPTVLLSEKVAAALGAALASEPAEARRSGNIASRLTGALERLGLRIGRTGRLCSACSTALPKGSHFCPHCGEATEHEAVMCWNCFDTSLPSSARFCPRCGVLVHRAPAGS